MAETKTPAKARQSSLLGVVLGACFRRISGKRQHDYDSLTGVFSRHYMFSYWLAIASARQNRGKGSLAIGFIDVDDLKGKNDTLGHQATDQAIQHMVIVLDEAVYHACPERHVTGLHHFCLMDVKCPEYVPGGENAGANHRHRPYPCHAVARTGGDEFMISFFARSGEEAQAVADVIARQVSDLKHHTEFGYSIQTGMSVGIAWNPAWNIQQLANAADQAMYYAKNSRRADPIWNRAVMYDQTMEEERRAANAKIQARRNAVQNPYLRESYVLRVSNVEDNTTGGLLRTIPLGSYDPEMGPLSETDDIGHYGRVGIDLLMRARGILEHRPKLPALLVPISMDLLRGSDFGELLEAALSLRPEIAARIHLCLHGLEMKHDNLLVHQRLEVLRGRIGGFVIEGFGGPGGTMELRVLSAFPEVGMAMLHPSLIDEATHTKRGLVLLERVIQTCESLGMTPIITGVDTTDRARAFADLSRKVFPCENPIDAENWRLRRMFTGHAAGFLQSGDQPPQQLAS